MPIWTFVDYVEASGRSPFAEWLNGKIPAEAKTAINARFVAMMPMTRWPEKWVSNYEGYPGILEARIPWNKVQYRPLFMYSIEVRRQIIILNGAIEKNSKIPKADLNAADDRRKTLIREPGRVRRHQFT